MQYVVILKSEGKGNFAPEGAVLIADYVNIEKSIVVAAFESEQEQENALLWCIQNAMLWSRNDDAVYIQFPIRFLTQFDLYRENTEHDCAPIENKECINWKQGTPDDAGIYIVTLDDGRVDTTYYSDFDGWEYKDKEVIAWYPISNIESCKM